jgi:hypothetical protein
MGEVTLINLKENKACFSSKQNRVNPKENEKTQQNN